MDSKFDFRRKRILSLIACASILLSFVSYATALSFRPLYYDENGNLEADGVFEYVYDEANRLKEVKSAGSVVARYWYDHEGQRVKKWEGGVTTYYLGDTEVRKPDAGGTEVVQYYRANGELVAKDDSSGRKYYLTDHLGSPRVVLDAAGNKIEDIEYEPYGGILAGGQATNKLFTGKEKDLATGLYYYGARYYNPAIGRWTQPDTVIPDVYNPQDLNRYTYVRNNPLKYTDEDGQTPLLIPAAIIGGGLYGFYKYTKDVPNPADRTRTGFLMYGFGYASAVAVAIPFLGAALSTYVHGGLVQAGAYKLAIEGVGWASVVQEISTKEGRGEYDSSIEPAKRVVAHALSNKVGEKIVPVNGGWFASNTVEGIFLTESGRKIILKEATEDAIEFVIEDTTDKGLEQYRRLVKEREPNEGTEGK